MLQHILSGSTLSPKYGCFWLKNNKIVTAILPNLRLQMGSMSFRSKHCFIKSEHRTMICSDRILQLWTVIMAVTVLSLIMKLTGQTVRNSCYKVIEPINCAYCTSLLCCTCLKNSCFRVWSFFAAASIFETSLSTSCCMVLLILTFKRLFLHCVTNLCIITFIIRVGTDVDGNNCVHDFLCV